MDKQLTEAIQAYLDTPSNQRDVVQGATLLLSLNRNRILFQNVIRNPSRFADKVEYELNKHLKIRLDHQTITDVVNMDKAVVPSVITILNGGAPVISVDDDAPQEGKVVQGKRADHDALPDEIKKMWVDNAGLWFKIKETFEQLKSMEGAQACDRYEYLKILDECEKKYRANMQVYDGYVPGTIIEDKREALPDDPAKIANEVNAARKYLSSNKKKLADFKSEDTDKYQTLLSKVQERYNFLIKTGNAIDEAQVAELVSLGLVK